MKHLFLLLLFTSLCTVSLGQAGGEDCATATVITSIPFVGTGSTAAALDDYAENCPDVGNQGGAKDVVYKYTTGSSAEYVTLSLCIAATNYDSQLYVYQGSCSSGTSYACQEDGCTSPAYNNPYNSEIFNLMLQANTDYYFVVDGYSSGASGNYQLNVDFGIAPPTTQITFGDSSHLLPTSTVAARSGSPLAISDMNNDGLDDIIRLHNSQTVLIAYQQPNGTFTELSLGNIAPFNKVWAVCIADVDSNGYNDIATGDYNGIKLFTANSTGTSYGQSTVNSLSIFAQGMNFVDIDNDGQLDLFACNDVGESQLYVNSPTGLSLDVTALDYTTTPISDKSGNYASLFTDLDNDGDLDLYITKCRQGVTSTSDGRRINQWLENTGAGAWAENTTTLLRDSAQSWVTDFGDIDNDGDFDAIVVNHDQVSRFYRNLGNGVFEDFTASSGLTQTGFAGIQSYWRDFNNDGWLDLLVTGSEHRLWINNQDTSFTLDVDPFSILNDWMLSAVVGDLNHDGFLDIYGSYGSIYNTASTSATDRLWINQGASGNQFLQLDLTGVVSNTNAIGAKILAYGPWGVQVREVRGGEGYGTQNSFTQHFGLGASTSIDSLIIKWPSGISDHLYNVSSNQWLAVVEGSNPLPPVVLTNGVSSNITDSSASIALDFLLREDFDTDILFDYWPEGGSSTTGNGGTFNLSGGGPQSFNPSLNLFNLLEDTTYYWTANAIFDPNGSNQLFLFDTLTFNTLSSLPFDSIPVELRNFAGTNVFWSTAALSVDTRVRKDGPVLLEAHYWPVSSPGSVLVDSLDTYDLLGGNATTFSSTDTINVGGSGEYDFFMKATYLPDASAEVFYTDTIRLFITSSVDELSEGLLTIYPNPTTGTILIETTSELMGMKPSYRLFDSNGRLIENRNNPAQSERMKIEPPAGVYFLEVSTEDGRQRTYRIVKQ